jgi:hypothetical protein
MATRSFAGSPQNFNGAGEQGEQSQGFMGQIRGAGEAVQHQAQHVVSDYPLSTVLAVFGIGLGVGVVLGSAMFSSSSSCASSSSWFPSSMGSGRSSWFPQMASSNSSWFPSSSSGNSWFGGNSGQNWGESMMEGAKNMWGY